MEDNAWKAYKKEIVSKLSAQEIYGHLENQKPSDNEGWVSCKCPLHNDSKNSFGYNTKTLSFVCFASCGKGSVFDFLALTSGQDFKATLLGLGDKLNIPCPSDTNYLQKPAIDEKIVKQYVNALKTNEEVRRYLIEKRGLSVETLDKYEIGWDIKRQRNTIPIRDEQGNIANIRLYNAKKEPKIINFTDGEWKYGTPVRLYGIDELIASNKKQVILCEGEWDRIITQQEGFLAVTGTGGCGTFRPEWVNYFEEKDLVIIYDKDDEGQKAAHSVVLQAFKNTKIGSIKNVVLPLRGTKDDKDLTDFFHKRNLSASDLQKIIDETPSHNYVQCEEQVEIVTLNSFVEIEKKENISKHVQCDMTVCGETSETFHAVEEFRITFCQKLKEGKCHDCNEPIKVKHGSREYIGSCMSTDVQVINMLRQYCCKYGQKPSIEITKRTVIKEFFCHQRVNRISQVKSDSGEIIQQIDGKNQELVEHCVYYLSSDSIKPGNYLATGYVTTHPKSQRVTYLIETLIPQEDDYQAFRLENNIKHLSAFQQLSLNEIITDINNNVTKIYGHDEVLLSILLTYCSPLWIRFNQENIRGWLVSVIIGDSGLGKTQTYNKLAEFAGIGDCLSGITSTRTGLAYALSEHKQKGWQVKIGRYPANSGKILTIDEVQYISEEDIRTISKGMNEGFIQIDRVASKGYESMTRLIMLANPKKDRVMDSFSYGCESLKSVFPAPVIRRIDLGVFVNAGNVQGLDFINAKSQASKGSKITPDMLRAVIYWSWNLKSNQISFTNQAENDCLAFATSLSKMYGNAGDIPLVSPSDFRHTLARISAAFAVLSVSTNSDFSCLIIENKHVELAAELILKVYSHDNCGLDTYSDNQRKNNQVDDYDTIKGKFIDLKNRGKFSGSGEQHFIAMIDVLRSKDVIRRDDLAEQVGCSADTISTHIKFLKRYNLIDTGKRGYFKTPKFVKFLRKLVREKDINFFG